MKFITKFFRNNFTNLLVTPLHALVIGILIVVFSPVLALIWTGAYATMFYGHSIHLAVEDWDNYSRYTPYAEADLRFSKAVISPIVKLVGALLTVVTCNVWFLIAAQLTVKCYNQSHFSYYPQRYNYAFVR